MITKGIGARIERAASIFYPSKNGIHTTNTGVRALLYGKAISNANGKKNTFGLIHVLTAARFKNEIMRAQSLRHNSAEYAAEESDLILASIPKSLRNAFVELKHKDGFMKIPIVEKSAKYASKMRKYYDKLIDKPIAKIRSGIYFGWHSIKDSIAGLSKESKANEVDMGLLKRLFPNNIALPYGTPKEELKEFLIKKLKKCNYTDNEIQAVLEGKNPVFYSFVDEAELRVLKRGKKLSSSDEYSRDFNKIDVTTDPNYNKDSKRYRITFKIHPKWNPFQEGGSSLIQSNDMTKKTWKLTGGYSKKDILCYERVG